MALDGLGLAAESIIRASAEGDAASSTRSRFAPTAASASPLPPRACFAPDAVSDAVTGEVAEVAARAGGAWVRRPGKGPAPERPAKPAMAPIWAGGRAGARDA